MTTFADKFLNDPDHDIHKPQFCAIAATGGVGLGGTTSTSSMDRREPVPPTKSTTETWPPQSEPAYLISEIEARRLVTAIDNCRPSDVIAVIQRQPWFREVRRGIRAMRHLKPSDFIKLSEGQAPACPLRTTRRPSLRASNRPREMHSSLDAVGSDGCKIGLTTLKQTP